MAKIDFSHNNIDYRLLLLNKSLSYSLFMKQNKFLKSIGEKVRTLRKVKNMSQERLAELSGLHPTYISDTERGKVNASIYVFYMVANALEVPFPELVNLSSVEMNKKLEGEISSIVAQLRTLSTKKQLIFLSAVKGLLSGIEQI